MARIHGITIGVLTAADVEFRVITPKSPDRNAFGALDIGGVKIWIGDGDADPSALDALIQAATDARTWLGQELDKKAAAEVMAAERAEHAERARDEVDHAEHAAAEAHLADERAEAVPA